MTNTKCSLFRRLDSLNYKVKLALGTFKIIDICLGCSGVIVVLAYPASSFSLLLKSGGSSIILSGGFGVYDFAFENFG